MARRSRSGSVGAREASLDLAHQCRGSSTVGTLPPDHQEIMIIEGGYSLGGRSPLLRSIQRFGSGLDAIDVDFGRPGASVLCPPLPSRYGFPNPFELPTEACAPGQLRRACRSGAAAKQ